MPAPTPEEIRQWLAEAMDCAHLQVAGDGYHFQALVVSAAFEGLSKVRRHQKIYAVLGKRMESDIHAISIRALTPAEWNG
jgi:acid stress-induced BolA-like protein IbaG/YrbA